MWAQTFGNLLVGCVCVCLTSLQNVEFPSFSWSFSKDVFIGKELQEPGTRNIHKQVSPLLLRFRFGFTLCLSWGEERGHLQVCWSGLDNKIEITEQGQ